MKAHWVLLATVVGCAAGAPAEEDAVDENVQEEFVPVALTMPEYPPGQAGRVVARSVSQTIETRLAGNWLAAGGDMEVIENAYAAAWLGVLSLAEPIA